MLCFLIRVSTTTDRYFPPFPQEITVADPYTYRSPMTYYLTELPPIKAKHRIEFTSSVSTAYLPCLLLTNRDNGTYDAAAIRNATETNTPGHGSTR